MQKIIDFVLHAIAVVALSVFAISFIALAATPAKAQQPAPFGGMCVAATEIEFFVGTPTPKFTKVFVDGDQDAWFVLENPDTGAAVIGVLLVDAGEFCGFALRKPTATPERKA